MPETDQRAIAKATKIQKQLMVFFHAYKCIRNDAKNPKALKCQLKHCNSFKRIILHLRECRNGDCTVQNCKATRNVLNHWNRCDGNGCVACGPLKRAHDRMQGDASVGDDTTAFLGNMTVDSDELGLQLGACNTTVSMDTTMGADMDTTIAAGGSTTKHTASVFDPWDDLLMKIRDCTDGMKHLEKVGRIRKNF